MCAATYRLILLTALGLAAACSGSSRECFTGADCASGECRADGTCVILAPGASSGAGGSSGTGSAAGSNGGSSGNANGSTGGSSAVTSSGSPGGSSSGSGSSSSSSGLASSSSGSGSSSSSSGFIDAGPNLCAFTGSVTSAQYPVGPGLAATYQVSDDAGFDSTGVLQGDGGYLWDMSGQYGDDHAVVVQTQAPSSEWFGSDYPGASYAVVLGDSSTNLGVFSTSGSAISLMGVASASGGAGDTELTYNPAVEALSFPFQLGSTWGTNSTVTGTLEGVSPVVYTEDYSSQVDKAGTLIIPSGTPFPVLRVQTQLTRTVGLVVVTQITYAFVTPCFGTVATLVSQLDEPGPEFANPSELERLAAP